MSLPAESILRICVRPAAVRAVVLAVLTLGLIVGRGEADLSWKEYKGQHFIVYYTEDTERAVARKLLRLAEGYYRKIGERIGYTRYSDFWLGDERVKVFLFPDQTSYVKATGQPAWSAGYADRDSRVFASRTIVSFERQNEFFDGLLPHEISHLILHDWVGEAIRIPVWFDEGVAQLVEAGKSAKARVIVRGLAREGQLLPLAQLMTTDIRRESDPRRVQIFYAQSLSLVEYLIRQYGSQRFGQLCRGLREGLSFADALHRAYGSRLATLDDLEEKWAAQIGR